MGTGNNLEVIVNRLLTPIRISPAGVLGLVGGPALLAGGLFLSVSDSFWVRCVGAAMAPTGFGGTVLGIMMYCGGVQFYKEAQRLFGHRTANQHMRKIVAPNLYYYCTRNAYHAAAKVTGLGQDFELVNAAYNGPRENRWLPGV